MIDVSVFMPAIRVHNWKKMYESLQQSCKRHTWELVLVSPFDLPSELKDAPNIKLIKDFGSPSRCAQLAFFECEGRLIYHCVDDALFLDDRIDEAIDQYDRVCTNKDAINMRYCEGQNYSGHSMPMGYWTAWYHGDLRLPGIPQAFKISLHHLMSAEYFAELGGYDCEYEYQNFNLHDLMFRLQADGGKIYDSEKDVTTCDHAQGDHKVIEAAHHQHDFPLFVRTYGDSNVLKNRIKIDLNNWSKQPSFWVRRFQKGIPKDYQELVV